MTDNEMLELAAKAYGIEIHFHKDSGSFWIGGPRTWNPLTDDGDALRLAVKLKLFNEPKTTMYGLIPASIEDEPYAATRRAIVRAAAEIGKAMK